MFATTTSPTPLSTKSEENVEWSNLSFAALSHKVDVDWVRFVAAAVGTADTPNEKSVFSATQRVAVDRDISFATCCAQVCLESVKNHIPVAVIQSSSSLYAAF